VKALEIKLLGPSDASTLRLLAQEDAAFGLEARAEPAPALSPADAEGYLRDPHVLHWVAADGGRIAGHLLCYRQLRRIGAREQLLLYEIGVRASRRRQGVGRALCATMADWMRDHGVAKAWVLADNPGAQAFYQAMGFSVDEPSPVQMTLHLA